MTGKEVTNRNLTNLYMMRRGKFEHLEFKHWQLIERVITHIQNTYHKTVINTMISQGKNITCCLKLPMISIDKAVKNAYDENTDCFKNESSTYEKFVTQTLLVNIQSLYFQFCFFHVYHIVYTYITDEFVFVFTD